jgi:hypothetical protein
MKKTIGYEITEPDIEKTLNYLKTTIDKKATREDAIEYLREHQSMAHVVAHKIVEDEKNKETKNLISHKT